MMTRIFVTLLILGSSACGTGDGHHIAPAAPPRPDSCGTSDHLALIGKSVAAMEQRVIYKPLRVIRPGTAVTMDFLPDRVNVHLNTEDLITRISCG